MTRVCVQEHACVHGIAHMWAVHTREGHAARKKHAKNTEKYEKNTRSHTCACQTHVGASRFISIHVGTRVCMSMCTAVTPVCSVRRARNHMFEHVNTRVRLQICKPVHAAHACARVSTCRLGPRVSPAPARLNLSSKLHRCRVYHTECHACTCVCACKCV